MRREGGGQSRGGAEHMSCWHLRGLLASERVAGEQRGVSGGQDGTGCAIREVGELGRVTNADLRIPRVRTVT